MKKVIDPLQTAGVKKPATTMFEVYDKGRENEFNYRSRIRDFNNYVPDFVSFIESLGFEIGERQYATDSIVKINGQQFHIDTNNCSYKSRNAYTREVNIRKPENRFIRLIHRGDTVLKIHFNKEYEISKLKAKIFAAMDYEKELLDKDIQRENEKRDNTIAIARHYLQNYIIKSLVQQIYIDRGTITFYLNDHAGSVDINTNGSIIKAHAYNPDMKSITDIMTYRDQCAEHASSLSAVATQISLTPPISKKLKAWADTGYYNTFYTATMSTEKYYIK